MNDHTYFNATLTNQVELLTCIILTSGTAKRAAYFEEHGLVIPRGHQAVRLDLVPEVSEKIKVLLKVCQGYQDARQAYEGGEQQFRQREYEKTMQAFTAALCLKACNKGYYFVDESHCYLERGWCKMLMKDYQGALEETASVIALEPNNLKAYCTRAWAYLLSMQTACALEAVNQALERKQDSAEAHGILALLALHEGDLSKAWATAQRAVALVSRDSGIALFILAHLYRLKGEKEVYKRTLLKAQKVGDDQHRFNLIDDWIATVEKPHIEKCKDIDRQATQLMPTVTPAFLPHYSMASKEDENEVDYQTLPYRTYHCLTM